jgi:hypothetical protein
MGSIAAQMPCIADCLRNGAVGKRGSFQFTSGNRHAPLYSYQSEAAFQRALKARMGTTPAQWGKMQEPSGRTSFQDWEFRAARTR